MYCIHADQSSKIEKKMLEECKKPSKRHAKSQRGFEKDKKAALLHTVTQIIT